MIRLYVALVAAVMACGPAFAQGRLPSGSAFHAPIIDSPVFSGTLSAPWAAWAAPFHEAAGGTSQGHMLGWMDQNQLLTADYWKISSGDQSLYTRVAVTGTPTATETPGLEWTVSGVLYHVRYTVQGGDTNQAVALGICNAISTTPGLAAALAAFRGADGIGTLAVQTGCVNQTGGGVTLFDQPWAPSGNTLTAFSTTHTTVAITDGANLAISPKLDGGPFVILNRYVPGYQPRNGDQAGVVYWEGQTGPTSGFSQIGAIAVTYAGNGTSTFNTRMLFNAAGDGGNSQTVFGISKGLYVNNAGATCLGDPGYGGMSACNVYTNNFFLGTDAGQALGHDGSGNTQVLAQSGKNLVLATYSGSASMTLSPTATTFTGSVLGSIFGASTYWFSGNPNSTLYQDGSGNTNLAAQTGKTLTLGTYGGAPAITVSTSGIAITTGAGAGVSCAAGTVSLTTLVVTNGIVTHC